MSAPVWLQVTTAAAVTFALAMAIILLYRKSRDRQTEEAGVEMHVSPYIRRAALLTPAERLLYARLHQALGNEVLVCPKVRLADIIEVRGDALEWQAAWNRIAAKAVDFVLMTADDYQPLLAVQLESGRSSPRDEWLDRAIMAAGLPLLRIRARSDYDPAALRREVEQRLAAASQQVHL